MCEYIISNITGHNCVYTICNNIFYDYRTFCTYNSLELKPLGILSIIFLAIIIYWLMISMPKTWWSI